jgi:predicted dehydrogenase
MAGGQYGDCTSGRFFVMRVLIVGTGSIGRRHIRNLQALVDQPQFIFMRDSARRDALSDEMDATVVGTFEAAIALRPELAVIATPSIRHLDALLALLPAHIPCYVEKPVVATEEQAKLLERLLGGLSACPATLVGCNLRHLPSLQRVRGLLQSGAIGQPVRASFQVGQWLPDWRPAQDYRLSYSADPGRGGGVALDLVHEFDAARWLFGEFDQVFAVGGHYSRLEIGSEDSATILLGRTGGPAVAVGLDYVARQPMRRYEIIGDEGTLVWDLVGRRLEHASPNGNELIDCGEAGFETAATYVTAMTKMLAAVRSRQPTSQDIVDGLCSVRLALNVNHQLRS